MLAAESLNQQLLGEIVELDRDLDAVCSLRTRHDDSILPRCPDKCRKCRRRP
jgi:hypothetical protein